MRGGYCWRKRTAKLHLHLQNKTHLHRLKDVTLSFLMWMSVLWLRNFIIPVWIVATYNCVGRQLTQSKLFQDVLFRHPFALWHPLQRGKIDPKMHWLLVCFQVWCKTWALAYKLGMVWSPCSWQTVFFLAALWIGALLAKGFVSACWSIRAMTGHMQGAVSSHTAGTKMLRFFNWTASPGGI